MCEELGRKEEAERKEREAMFAQGYQKRVQYEQQGIRSVNSPSLLLSLSLSLSLSLTLSLSHSLSG